MDMRVVKGCEPFLKWPGGKRWVSDYLSTIIQDQLRGKYVEPFLGGGAVFLRLQPETSILSDINSELIDCLSEIVARPHDVISRLRVLSNDSDSYYKIRNQKLGCSLDAAVRFIYLNKTAWGGMYRLNKRGEFNVPFGNSGREILDEKVILAASTSLRKAQLACCDFEATISSAGEGDVVYADPPYSLPSNNGGGFLRYNDKIFGWDDQVRLSKAARQSVRRGAKVIVSGHWDESLLELYKGWFAVRLSRSSTIARKSEARKPVFESLIMSFDPGRNYDAVKITVPVARELGVY